MVKLNLQRRPPEPRPADVPATSGPSPEDLEAVLQPVLDEVNKLRSDLDWLGLEVKKLRGKITGGIRHNDTGNGDAPPPPSVQDINAAIKAGTFRRG